MIQKLKLLVLSVFLLSSLGDASAQIATAGMDVYAYLGHYNDPSMTYDKLGWYKITSEGEAQPQWYITDSEFCAGYVYDGALHAIFDNRVLDVSMGMYYLVVDLSTGAEISRRAIDVSNGIEGFDCLCFNPDDNMAYGFVQMDYYNPQSGCEQAFCKIDPQNPASVTIIKKIDSSLDRCMSIAYCPKDAKMYGINRWGNLVTVAADGQQTEVFTPRLLDGSVAARAQAGLIYNNKTDKFVWNALSKDGGTSHLYTIDAEAKTVERVSDFRNGEQFFFFASLDNEQKHGAPARPEILSNTFAGTPDLTGSISVKMPLLYADGSEMTAGMEVSLVSKLDDVVHSTITCVPGETAVVEFAGLSQGKHTFSFNAVVAGESSSAIVWNAYIGHDAPKAPANVRFNAAGVRWDAVTESANGGYLDIASVTYSVYVDDVEVVSGVTGTSYAYTMPTVEAGVHQAAVVAVANGVESERGLSNKFTSSGAFELDRSFVPTADEALLMTLTDANRDGNTWHLYEPYMYEDPYFSYASNNRDADDWIFLPAINFPSSSNYYEFSMDARRGQADVAETFEVYIGKSPDPFSMVQEIIAPTGPDTYNWQNFKTLFAVEEAGVYYIGIHATSLAGSYYLFVNHFNVKRAHSIQNAPSAASNLKATAASEGALFARVEFTMPTTYSDGRAISADADLTAIVRIKNNVAEVSGKPGSDVVIERIAAENGVNEVSVQVCEGEDIGLLATAKVYVGIDYPLVVPNLVGRMSEDNMTIHLTWDAPTEGANGGYVNPQGITYWLVRYVSVQGTEYAAKDRELGVDVFEADYVLPVGSALATERIGVVCANEAGDCEYLAILHMMAGTPYALPMSENFGGQTLRYSPLTIANVDETDNAQWGIDDMSQYDRKYATATGRALVALPTQADSKGRIALPKFKSQDYKPRLSFNVYMEAGMPQIKIFAQNYDMDVAEEVRAIEYSGTEGWANVVVDLGENYANRGWVATFIDVAFSSMSQKAMIATYGFANGDATGIDAVADADEANIVVVAGGIDYYGLAAPLYVYNLSGVSVASVDTTVGHVALSPGMYIVVSGDIVKKVIVK